MAGSTSFWQRKGLKIPPRGRKPGLVVTADCLQIHPRT